MKNSKLSKITLFFANRNTVYIICGAFLIIATTVTIIATVIFYSKSETVYAKARDKYFATYNTSTTTENQSDLDSSSEPDQAVEWWEQADVDVERIASDYPDVVGWLWSEDSTINYPILFSGDNDKYIDTDYSGEVSKSGAIFIDGESSPDFSDPHTLIYGHNMRDGSMFGCLKKYKTDDTYYKEHQFFQVFLNNMKYRYQIFAFMDVSDTHDVYETYGKDPRDIYNLILELKRGSYTDTGVDVDASDHIITLSTCTADDDERFIVCAVRVDEKNKP